MSLHKSTLRPLSSGLLLLAALAACSGNSRVVGTWEGNCLLDTDQGVRRLPFEIEIVSQRGGQLDGAGEYLFNGYTFHGDVNGSVDGDEVEFELLGVYGGYTVTLFADGSVDEGEIEGSCSFFEIDGELDLEAEE